ncbi:SRPBCC family protein [Dictyobacter arantiisoli]|uniref:Polyketide cyclase n=1 Tax=Dictyobacter arantiisoli TaxID=2014874 RepID=A0A5A5TIT5_9CHLR|nr:SRPBCC family protein [Dictyobacter arantiisoli]GCF11036.1 hypothetical protein KDI_46000 [Dictyobacter arantiisoli]
MPHLGCHIVIQRSPETIYQLILDLSGYKVWLPASQNYHETLVTSDYPLRVGSTYVDRGRAGELRGEIVQLEPARRIVFQQVLTTRRSVLTTRITYTLLPVTTGTQVTREVDLHPQGLLMFIQFLFYPVVKKENQRILHAMQHYLNARATQ